jgi:hypothetical protein
MEEMTMSEKTARRLKFIKFFENRGKLGKLKKTWANLENLNCKMVEYQQFSNNSSFPKMEKIFQVFPATMSIVSRALAILNVIPLSPPILIVWGIRPHTSKWGDGFLANFKNTRGIKNGKGKKYDN